MLQEGVLAPMEAVSAASLAVAGIILSLAFGMVLLLTPKDDRPSTR